MVLHARPPPPHPPPPTAAICCTKAQAEAFWAPPAVTHQYPSPTGHGWGPETSDHTFPSRGPSGGLKAPARAPVPTRWVGATKQPPILFSQALPCTSHSIYLTGSWWGSRGCPPMGAPHPGGSRPQSLARSHGRSLPDGYRSRAPAARLERRQSWTKRQLAPKKALQGSEGGRRKLSAHQPGLISAPHSPGAPPRSHTGKAW